MDTGFLSVSHSSGFHFLVNLTVGYIRTIFHPAEQKRAARKGDSWFLITQKSPDLSVETTWFLKSTIMKRWFRSCDLHTRSFTNSFVCNFLSSSVGINLCSCFSRLALALRFRFRLSLGFHFHGLLPLPLLFLTPAVFAFFRPLQFWVLTTQPLFLPFPFLPASASQGLRPCSSSAFASYVFPVLSCLVSRAFLPGFGTQLHCMFPFALPRFAPTAVPQVLTSSFRFPYFPLPFRFLSSASVSLPATQPSVSSFPFFPFLPHSGFFGAPFPLSLPGFLHSFLPDFSCILSWFPYSAF